MHEQSVHFVSHSKLALEGVNGFLHTKLIGVTHNYCTEIAAFPLSEIKYIIENNLRLCDRCFLPSTSQGMKGLLLEQLLESCTSRFVGEFSKGEYRCMRGLDEDIGNNLVYSAFGKAVFKNAPSSTEKIRQYIGYLHENNRISEVNYYNSAFDEYECLKSGKRLEDDQIEEMNRCLGFTLKESRGVLYSLAEDLTGSHLCAAFEA